MSKINTTVDDAKKAVAKYKKHIAELRTRRDQLTNLLRGMNDSIRRLERQIEVTSRSLDDEYSREMLKLITALVEKTMEPLVALVENAAPVEPAAPITYPGVTMILMTDVLKTLADPNPPLSLEEALLKGLGENWAEKAYSLKDGGKTVRYAVAEGKDETMVISPQFRVHLTEIFRRLYSIHHKDFPEGTHPSKALTQLNAAIGERWQFVERIVVDRWLSQELADLAPAG